MKRLSLRNLALPIQKGDGDIMVKKKYNFVDTKTKNTINCLSEGKENITNPNDIANSFNTYFCSIADNLLKT